MSFRTVSVVAFVDEVVGFFQALPVTLWLALVLLVVFVAIVGYRFPKRPGSGNGDGPPHPSAYQDSSAMGGGDSGGGSGDSGG